MKTTESTTTRNNASTIILTQKEKNESKNVRGYTMRHIERLFPRRGLNVIVNLECGGK